VAVGDGDGVLVHDAGGVRVCDRGAVRVAVPLSDGVPVRDRLRVPLPVLVRELAGVDELEGNGVSVAVAVND
jgi:hypothetical protein